MPDALADITSPAPRIPGVSTPLPDISGYQKYIAPEQNALEKAGRAKAELDVASQQFEADQKEKAARSQADLERQYADRVRNSPERAEMKDVEQQLSKPFIPTKENTKDLTALFSLVNIVGFALGAGGKTHAQAAMSAMNGMLEGHQQGRADLYKREKDTFDENIKQLKTKFDVLEREFKSALETYKTDKEAGQREIDVALAKAGADFLRANLEKRGIAATLPLLTQVFEAKNKMWTEIQREIARADQQAWREKEFAMRQQQHREDMAQRAQFHKDSMEKQGGRALQQQFMAQRAVNGLGGVASAVESLQQLPAGTTTGILPNLKTKDGMMNFLRNAGARKVTSDEAEAMNTLFTGIGRNLASIEASGAATGLQHLADQMQSGLYINAGVDTPHKVAIKLADIRRVATENIRPAIESGLLPPQQAEVARKLVERIEKAIPYTTTDVANAISHGRAPLGEAARKSVPKEGDKDVSKSGKPMVFRDGKWEYE